MPTLVMMHGMTGNSEMMRPMAERICPDGWDLLVPNAPYEHDRRGLTWWRYEDNNRSNRSVLTPKELAEVDSSLYELARMMPDDKLVLGGFSQGGVMAQEMLQLPLSSSVLGVICIGTRCIRPLELSISLAENEKKSMFWMHGETDHRVSLKDGREVADLFSSAGWDVTEITHQKGHMIPMEYQPAITDWLLGLTSDID